MTAPLLALLAAMAAAVMAVRHRRRLRLPARSVIISPRHSTVIDDHGAVRSVQSAEITMSEQDLARLWLPVNLQNLARTYWIFLQRVTLGLIHVQYEPEQRRVQLVFPRITLLAFEPPEYDTEPGHGHVRWKIRDGLLVSKPGRESGGFLGLDVRRLDPASHGRARVRIEVEVANFYPSIASRFSMPAYRLTQAFIHVLVTHAFLRSLASLDLAQSQLAPFAVPNDGRPQPLAQADAGPTESGREA